MAVGPVVLLAGNALGVYHEQLGNYPTPINISYFWSFGSISGIFMAWQAVTGLGLAALYIPSADVVASSLEGLGRDGVLGWLLRGMHSNMPGMIFIALYLHQTRSLVIGSRPTWTWLTGWVILLLSIVAAFLGYSLVWSQMSYWAATVITSLLTVVPVGDQILGAVWGAPLIAQSTLSRFLAWHYLLPLAVLALAVIHMAAIHSPGSSQPLTVASVEKIPFVRYLVSKDAVALAAAVLVVSLTVLGAPSALMDVELYMGVNTMSTPEHIVPEFYLLPYYALLRCVPNKAMGCIGALGLLLLVADHQHRKV